MAMSLVGLLLRVALITVLGVVVWRQLGRGTASSVERPVDSRIVIAAAIAGVIAALLAAFVHLLVGLGLLVVVFVALWMGRRSVR